MTVLVVGATGQLGTAVTLKASDRHERVRAFVRSRSRSSFGALERENVEFAFGDLSDEESVRRACRGVQTVIATATSVFPRGRYDFAAEEGQGYRHLIDACEAEGVEQIIFMSNYGPFISPYIDRIPSLRFKRDIEVALQDSRVAHTIFRGAPFMDDYFALIGSDIPLRGAQNATLARPFWFSRYYVQAMAGMIEKHGVALVPGSVHARHAFIALEDVAMFLVNAIGHSAALNATHIIGGPANLSWLEVAALYERLLGRRVRALPSITATNRLGATLLRRISPAAANQMGLLWIMCENENVVDRPQAPAELFGVELMSGEEFLRSKLAMAVEHG